MGECYYLAIDPGDTTGWADFDIQGNLNLLDSVHGKEAVYELLDSLSPTMIIMEDYRLYPWKDKEQHWSPFDTVRIIGAVEHWCWQHGVKLTLQPASIKSIGYLWAGQKKPKQKSRTHEMDAYVHGVYYLQSQGIRTPQQGRAPSA